VYQEVFGISGDMEVWRYTTFGTSKRPQPEFDALDVFYLSVRVMGRDPYTIGSETPILRGLLILPTGKKNGQFRRVGMFEVCDHFKTLPLGDFTCATDISDSRFFKTRHENGGYTVSIV
jgi:hypothetical protein